MNAGFSPQESKMISTINFTSTQKSSDAIPLTTQQSLFNYSRRSRKV